MGATFARIKTWVDAEDVEFSDLNAEFDNILNNMNPSGIGDYSTNAAQMRTQTDPGTFGSESLATSLAGEIERLRYVISRIIDGDNTSWYDTIPVSLSSLELVLREGTLPKNRITSGYVRTDSNFPDTITPASSSLSVTVRANASNPLVYFIDGTKYEITSDISLSSLSAAPSTNNTATITLADFAISSSAETPYTGEYGEHFRIGSVGSEITALDEEIHAFKYNNGTSDEFLIGRVVASGTDDYLTDCIRGYFFNNSRDPVEPVNLVDATTLTLLKMGWLFITTAGGLDITYNPPFVQDTEPTSPDIGDYWFDVGNETWKQYSGSSWDAANATLLGICASDSSGTVVARPFEYWQNYESTNGYTPTKRTAEIVRSSRANFSISVAGRLLHYPQGYLEHDITTDLVSGLTEASETEYYIYLTRDGKPRIDTLVPIDRRRDLKGFYHRYHDWRCIGAFVNDNTSTIDNDGVRIFERRLFSNTQLDSRNGHVEGYFFRNAGDSISTSSTAGAALVAEIPFTSTGLPIVAILGEGGSSITEGGGSGNGIGTVNLQRAETFSFNSPQSLGSASLIASASSTSIYSTIVIHGGTNPLSPGFHALRIMCSVGDASDTFVINAAPITIMEVPQGMPPGSN